MKILKFKGKMSLTKKLLIIFLVILVIAIVIVSALYVTNEETRNWININILKKEVTEEDIATIELDTDKTQYIYAYDKYIVILCNGTLEIYNGNGNKAFDDISINISNPIFETCEDYLIIAETDGQKIYYIEERKNNMGKCC